jgi:hypothetical protein
MLYLHELWQRIIVAPSEAEGALASPKHNLISTACVWGKSRPWEFANKYRASSVGLRAAPLLFPD